MPAPSLPTPVDPEDPRAALVDVTGEFTEMHDRCHAALSMARADAVGAWLPGSTPGTGDRIVAEVKQRWPQHAALHRGISVPSPVREGGNTEAVIELSVHIALSMIQQECLTSDKSSPTPTHDGPRSVTVDLPAAEHDIDGEDEHGRWTQNPGWETRGLESGLISAWAQGVSVEGALHEDGDVLDLEETARKVLAAVAWHRHYAAQDDT